MADTILLLAFALLQIMFFFVHEASSATCHPSGFVHGKDPNCAKNDDTCCAAGKRYPTFRCSPPASAETPAILELDTFSNGEVRSLCDGRVHSDMDMVVSLSSGWLRLDGTNRCNKVIRVAAANGRSVLAGVVDECDSVRGCGAAGYGSPPCRNNVEIASRGIWRALGLDERVEQFHNGTWSDV